MRSQELNLLNIFDTIMIEGSITRAAERLAMTQPAVSSAVSRMRVIWKDELFVKVGRTIQPTLYAQNLWEKIREPIASLNQIVNPSEFSAAESPYTFRVAATDSIVSLAWPTMRQVIESEAPNLNLHAIPYDIVNGERLLSEAMVDLVVAPINLMSSLLNSEYLFESHFVCVMSPDNPLANKNLTLKRFAEAEHLLVSLSGDTTGVADQELARQNLKRRVAMTINNFSSATPILASSNMIAMLPSFAIERAIVSGELIAKEAPISLAGVRMGFFWHKRQEQDMALQWLREKLATTIRQRIEQHEEIMKQYVV